MMPQEQGEMTQAHNVETLAGRQAGRKTWHTAKERLPDISGFNIAVLMSRS